MSTESIIDDARNESLDDYLSSWKSELQSKSKSELSTEAKKLGIKSSGNKATLIDRIIKVRRSEWLASNERNDDNEKSQATSITSGPTSFARCTGDNSRDSVDMSMIQVIYAMMQQQQRNDEERRRQDEERIEERRSQDEERREERRREGEVRKRQEEERREDQRRFSEILLESQNRFLQAVEALNIATNTSRSIGPGISCELDNEMIKALFQMILQELQELLHKLNEHVCNNQSYYEVESLLKRCEVSMNSLNNFQEQKVVPFSNACDREKMVEEFRKITDEYYSASPHAKAYLDHLRRIENEEKNAGPLPPNIELPLFYGNILSFPTFWDSFEPIVHNNTSVSRFYKLKYLKDAMKGSAFGVLDSYELIAENYDAAVQHIQKRWGKPEAATRRLINSLLESNKANEDFRSLQKLLDNARVKKALLEKSKVTKDQIILQIIEHQLPVKLQEEWIEKVVSPAIERSDILMTDNLFKFIETKLNAKEVLYSSRKSLSENKEKRNNEKKKDNGNPYKEPKSTTWKNDDYREKSSAHALVTNQKKRVTPKRITCPFCQGDHSLPQCPDFTTLDEKDRHYTYHSKMRYLCNKCLLPKDQDGHPKNPYKCEGKCDTCQGFHHKLLHLSNGKSSDDKSNKVTRTLLTKKHVDKNENNGTYRREIDSVDTYCQLQEQEYTIVIGAKKSESDWTPLVT